MKQQGRRAARTGYVIRKRLKLLGTTYLLCVILNSLGWSKVKQALMLILYLKNSVIYSFGLGFSLPQLISDCVSCLVIHNIW